MIGLSKGEAVDVFDVAFYFDRDEGLWQLPDEDVHKFDEKAFNVFPERKDGRFSCVVKVYASEKDHYKDVEDRAIDRAKMLIGLEKQRIKIKMKEIG